MKRFSRILLRTAFIAFCASSSQVVHASDFGCRVLLCLANPKSNGGPWAISECVPDLRKLFHDLARGHSFPTCDMSDGNDGTSHAQMTYDFYDPCPEGMKPAEKYQLVTQAGPGWTPTGFQYSKDDPGNVVGGVHSSETEYVDDSQPAAPRACVGNLVGTETLWEGDVSETLYVFDSVIWQKAQNPYAIDVYIDNKLWQRVHWQ